MRLMRMREVEHLTARSRTSIWRDVKAGTFPHPVPIGGRAIAFVEEEVESWVHAKVEERDEALGICEDSNEEVE